MGADTHGEVHFPKPNTSGRDWVEDFSHENGNYQNKCMDCGLYFYGHKRRVVCKICDVKVVDDNTNTSSGVLWLILVFLVIMALVLAALKYG